MNNDGPEVSASSSLGDIKKVRLSMLANLPVKDLNQLALVVDASHAIGKRDAQTIGANLTRDPTGGIRAGATWTRQFREPILRLFGINHDMYDRYVLNKNKTHHAPVQLVDEEFDNVLAMAVSETEASLVAVDNIPDDIPNAIKDVRGTAAADEG